MQNKVLIVQRFTEQRFLRRLCASLAVVMLFAMGASVTAQEMLMSPPGGGAPPVMPGQAQAKPESPFPEGIETMQDPLQAGVVLMASPVQIPDNFSMMFTTKDMDSVINAGLSIYKALHATDTSVAKEKSTDDNDDLSKLLESFKGSATTKTQVQSLPYLYLGSILYYSPSQWSVWINGKKLPSHINNPDAIFYVKSISREGGEFVWKPPFFAEVQKKWNELSANPENLPKNLSVDVVDKSITFTLKPNQTLMTSRLRIEEGLVVQPAGERGVVSSNVGVDVQPVGKAPQPVPQPQPVAPSPKAPTATQGQAPVSTSAPTASTTATKAAAPAASDKFKKQ